MKFITQIHLESNVWLFILTSLFVFITWFLNKNIDTFDFSGCAFAISVRQLFHLHTYVPAWHEQFYLYISTGK